MAVCERRRIKKINICIGDLDKPTTLVERVLVPPEIGESEPTIEINIVEKPWAGIETLNTVNSGLAKFNQINIEDRPTHIFLILFNPELPNIETGNHFFNYCDRYFRVIKVKNVNEQQKFLSIDVKETGNITVDANVA